MLALMWAPALGAVPGFSVKSFTPEGLVSPRDYIKITFSSEVVTSDEVGRELRGSDMPLTLSPQLDGRGGWLDQSTLIYGAELAPATSYRAEVDKGLRDIHGKVISGKREFEFHTEPLSFVSAKQVDFSLGGDYVDYEVAFSLPVNPSEFVRFFKVTDLRGASLPVSLRNSEISPVMNISVRADTGSPIEMRIEKGLSPAQGALGLPDVVSFKMDRDIALKIHNSYFQGDSYDGSCIYLETTSNIDAAKAESFIELSPPIPFRLESYGSSLRIYADLKPRGRVTVRAKKGLPALDAPGLGEDWIRSFVVPDLEKSLRFSSNGHIISHVPDSLAIPIESMNVDSLNVDVRRAYDNNVPFLMLDGWPYYMSELYEEVFSESFLVNAKPNESAKSVLDIKKILNGRKGLFLLNVKTGEYGWPYDQRTINVTDIAGTLKVAGGSMLAWANSISTGKPMSGVNVRVYSRSNQLLGEGRTDRNGVWEKRIYGGWDEKLMPRLAIFSKDDDVAVLPFESDVARMGEAYGGEAYVTGGYQTLCYTPRGVFRPGESVPIFVLLRELDFSLKDPFPVQVKIRTPQWREWETVTVELSSMGMGSTVIQLSDAAPTGSWGVEVYIPGEKNRLAYGTFMVEDFAPPRINVDLKSDATELFGGEKVSLSLASRYLFGSPSDGLDYEIVETFIPREYTNPKWPGYAFRDDRISFTAESATIAQGALSVSGDARVEVDVPKLLSAPSILDASFQAGVMQNDGRWVYRSFVLPYYPRSTLYGIKAPDGIINSSSPTSFSLAAVDHKGNPLAPRGATLTVFRVVNNTIVTRTDSGERNEYRRELIPLSEYNKVDVEFKDGLANTEVTFPSDGMHVVAVSDEDSGASAAIYVYVYNARWGYQGESDVPQETLELKLDRELYKLGDKPRVIVSSPYDGTVLLTVETNGILRYEVAATKNKSAEFTFRVTEEMMPNAWITADLVRPVTPEEQWSAHRLFGAAPLQIDCASRALSVDIKAPERIMPLEEGKFSLSITDSNGRGVVGEVTLMLVDDGVLSLTRYATPDPFEYFTRRRGLSVSQYDVYDYLFPVLLDIPQLLTPGGGAYDESELSRASLSPVRADRFKILSLWQRVVTDRNGRADFSFDLPEFSGSARMMAVAASRGAFGSSEKFFTISRNVIVDQSLPRAAAPGDTFESGVLLFNKTGVSLDLEFEMNIDGPLSIIGADTPDDGPKRVMRKIELPPDDSVFEVPFSLMADEDAGVAQVRTLVSYADGGAKESAEIVTDMPVRPPFPRISMSGGLMIKPGESGTVTLPGDWLDGTRRGRLAISGMPEVGLTDAAIFLVQYPYGCLEQTVSSAWTLLAQPDLVASLDPNLATREQLAMALDERIRRIQSMQLYNGAFSSWPLGRQVDWNSVYATHFLVICERKGIPLQKEMLDSALSFIGETISVSPDPGTDATFSAGLALRAYASYVVSLREKPPLAWMAYLRDNITSMPLYGRILLAAAYARAGERDVARSLLGNIVPSVADYKASSAERPNLDSDIRNQAMSLLAWNEVDPSSSDALNNATALLESLRGAEWLTTHEAGFALPALADFFAHNRSEGAAILELSSGDDVLAATSGDKIKSAAIDGKVESLMIRNTGKGNGYASWTIDGVPTKEALAEDRGLKVRVDYTDAKGGRLGDVLDLTRGQKVIGKITLDGLAGTAENIVISLPMAGGLELENPHLMDTQTSGVSESESGGVRVELRDDRLLIFVDRLWNGRFKWKFSMRAVTAGVFTLPPVSAEGMYSPGARSTGTTSKVVIKTR
jgi:uncharacterized protein YfaS (alpha-2-macroglobulin family)